jgi:hypothetical protein
MKTVVYQSYRTVDVAQWIERCMESVRDWAELKGFDYAFIDDEIFDRVPDWYRQKANNSIWLMTDLARLELAREFLADGYDRTIWVDADILIFDPDRFDIDIDSEYAFCKEVWVLPVKEGKLPIKLQTNNSVTIFTRNNSFLDFYIYACQSIVRNLGKDFSGLEVGTQFLSQLYRDLRFQRLHDVGQFSPILCWDIVNGDGAISAAYIDKVGEPIRAANLCGSFRNRKYGGVLMDDQFFATVIDRLIVSKGDVVNIRQPNS